MVEAKSHGEKKNQLFFSPYRAVGFVSNHVPLDLVAKGTDHFVVTSVGKSYHMYNISTKLQLRDVGVALPEEISILRFLRQGVILAAAGSKIYILKPYRHTILAVYSEHQDEVVILISLGEQIVSVDKSNTVNVWSSEKNEDGLETYLSTQLDKDTFTITACMHPSTYLNKILFGSKQGKLQLWNIRTNKLIYEFKGWEEPVVCLEQSPAIDVIGIGLQSGHVVLYNLKYDKKVMSFHQEFGFVSSISFRTDGQSVMATGSPIGHISFWDLEKKQIITVSRNGHANSVTGMKFLHRQASLVTSSQDNSLKMWIFDNPDGSARLLKHLSAHSSPPTKSFFYGDQGQVLLTGGLDRSLRYSSVNRGLACTELSQGDVIKRAKNIDVEVSRLKLPVITCIAAESARAYDWDNIVTCHLGHTKAYTWNSQNRCIGKYHLKFQSANYEKPIAMCCDVSSCGNFAVVGYDNGHFQKYNIQSGIVRGSVKAHIEAIRGVHISSANLYIISTSSDKSIKFWRFKDLVLTGKIQNEFGITLSKVHRESSLLSIAFQDFTIKLFDIDTQATIRSFSGHRNVITDMSWKSDARWLVSSSIDGTIKTWDVPSARLIDCFLVDDPPTSVSFSPTSDMLATTHQDSVGIFLWTNTVKYTGIYPRPLPNDYHPSSISLPETTVDGQEQDESIEGESDVLDKNSDELKDYVTPEQLCEEMVTLSNLPDSKWKNLVNLDLIRSRNKPKEPPKKPKAAPFFLPSVSGLETKFSISKDNAETAEEKSRIIKNGFESDSVLLKFLNGGEENSFKLMELLKEMSPSEIETEFRMLGPEMTFTTDGIVSLMKAFITMLKSGKYYELVQAYITLFLKLHGDIIPKSEELGQVADEMCGVMDKTWSDCQQLLNNSTCLVKYFKSATI